MSAAGSLPRRERIAILTSLVGVTALCWVYLVAMASDMQASAMMGLRPWGPADFLAMFGMWVIMMVGMMVPSAIPMAMIYAAVARRAAHQGSSLAPTGVFVSGYVLAWTLFSVAATLAQWGLERAALLSPMLASRSPVLGAALLIGAGLYQMTPWKDACLRHCRSPARFISEHWKAGRVGALRMGAEHGFYCLGCCWALMGLLFFGGVMNLLWIAGITVFVLLEKILPFGVWAGRLAGGAAVAVGVVAVLGWC